jgi:hypothetical protein
MKKFSDLTEREVLAVAIASEEEDGRIYMSFAENLAERYPQSARIFEQVGIGEICQIGERAIDIRGAGHVGRRTQSVTCPRLASAAGVRRDKAALSSGCKSHPATAPAGSNRSSHGGNEVAEAFD